MKMRDDDLAGFDELEDEFPDSWPDQSAGLQQADPGHCRESLDDEEQEPSEPACPTGDSASEAETDDWPSEHPEEFENGMESKPVLPEEQAAPAKQPAQRRFPIRLVKVGALVVLGLVILAVGIVWLHHTWQQAQQEAQVVRHPVPHHLYKQQLNFFVLANSAQGEALVKLGLVFEFYAFNAYQQFQQRSLEEKDLVFGFLQQAHPRTNTQYNWQPIVQKKLLAYFQHRFPHNGIESIRLTSLDVL